MEPTFRFKIAATWWFIGGCAIFNSIFTIKQQGIADAGGGYFVFFVLVYFGSLVAIFTSPQFSNWINELDPESPLAMKPRTPSPKKTPTEWSYARVWVVSRRLAILAVVLLIIYTVFWGW